jgi:hypothetical protein
VFSQSSVQLSRQVKWPESETDKQSASSVNNLTPLPSYGFTARYSGINTALNLLLSLSSRGSLDVKCKPRTEVVIKL